MKNNEESFNPLFIKPSKIMGNNLSFVNASVDDAEFILNLRLDKEKSKFLSPTSKRIEEQKKWLDLYEGDDSQVYFIIKNKFGDNVGTVRLYDQKGSSFCWGSWIIKANAPTYYSIESALIVYKFALSLGFKNAHFDVRKKNKSVWKFHEKFGAIRIKETDIDYFYHLNNESILNSLVKYRKYLPNFISVLT